MTTYPKFVSPSIAAEIFGVTTQTLRRWAKSGKIKTIRTPGGQHRFDVSPFVGEPIPVAKAPKAAKVKAAEVKVEPKAEAPAPLKVTAAPIAPVTVPPAMAKPVMDAAALKSAIEALANAA